MHHLHFNHYAILVAALFQWFLGALWYSLLFNKPWMALTGHTKAEKPKGMVLSMVTSFIGGLILAFVLAHVIIWSPPVAGALSSALSAGWALWPLRCSQRRCTSSGRCSCSPSTPATGWFVSLAPAFCWPFGNDLRLYWSDGPRLRRGRRSRYNRLTGEAAPRRRAFVRQ